jgi:hypothetical protein
VAVCDTPALFTVIVTVPSFAASAVASPVAFMVATPVLLLDHVVPAAFVISSVELLVYVAIAVYCCVAPLAIVAFGGVRDIDVIAYPVTVTLAEPLTAPIVAVIEVEPATTPVTKPLLIPAVLPTVARDVIRDTQFAVSVIIAVLPLE